MEQPISSGISIILLDDIILRRIKDIFESLSRKIRIHEICTLPFVNYIVNVIIDRFDNLHFGMRLVLESNARIPK